MPDHSSCIENKPMMELSETQNPPVLDYNLPQTTSFVANVYLPLAIDTTKFKTAYKTHPASGESYYDKVSVLSTAQLSANIYDFFNHTPGSPWPPTVGSPLTSFARFRKDPNLSSSYTPYSGANPISVKGIIKNVTHRVLPTDSVIVDSLLGQGEALDCFNLKLQDASVLEAELDNDVTQQKLDIINDITDPAEKAALYKKVFT